jgi:hypothetical protein
MQQIEINGLKIGLHFGNHVTHKLVEGYAETTSVSDIRVVCDLIVYAHENWWMRYGGKLLIDRTAVYDWLEDGWDNEQVQTVVLQVLDWYKDSKAQKKMVELTEKLTALVEQNSVKSGEMLEPSHSE